ncbi:hypothetical protein PHMEG_0005529 [Phytophthora megakarya]|uniref:DUF7726 domain-containing protein n=1 Tax=Phytophthora megakarya TaxID=4795 RepID=A0A225WT20_9STRA|nr:hypothetical protein PHMEG_0005529 [Phytophthora megakarya]
MEQVELQPDPTKIHNFLGTKEITQSAFLKLCDINSNSYSRFVDLKRPIVKSLLTMVMSNAVKGDEERVASGTGLLDFTMTASM